MSAERGVAVPEGRLPVLAVADCVVTGATCAGLALALALVRRGRKVVVVEPRTYPGWEFTASLRPWVAEREAAAPPELFASWLQEAARPGSPGELALIPDVAKRGLENAVMAAGVDLLYAVPAIGLIREGRRIAGLVVGHKAGRRAVLTRHVVDATDWGMLGRLAVPGSFTNCAAEVSMARRTLEFTHVNAGDTTGVAAVLRDITGVRDAIVHRGHAGEAHALVELVLDLPLASPDLDGRMASEVAARRISIAVTERLRAAVPVFARARLAHTSWELHRLSPWRLAAPGTEVAPGLSVLSSCAPSAGVEAHAMLDPLKAAHAGHAAAEVADRFIEAAGPPDPARCEGQCAAGDDGHRAGADVLIARDAATEADAASVALRAESVPLLRASQVLVAGGGTSGATAGAVAAGEGVRTVLLEMNSGLGGAGTVGGVDSYWYGRRVGFTREVDVRTKAVAARLGLPSAATWNVEAKMHALLEWSLESGCEVYFGCVAVAALMDGTRVIGVLAATPDGLRAVTANVTVDASGDGDVAAAAGASFVYGSGRDAMPMWTLLAPVPEPGRPSNHFTSAADIRDVRDYTRAIVAGRRIMPGHDHAAYLAPRETRHIRGGVVLSLTDHVLLRTHPDTINLCFSNCDIKGRSVSDWVGFGILPPNAELEIPYRAVVPEGIEGLLVAGRAYSCTHDFLATARMQADLQNQGGAVALAAVRAAVAGIAPRAVDVSALQDELRRRGVLPPDWRPRIANGSPHGEELRSLVEHLAGDEPMILDQGFDDITREPFTIVRLCAAGPEAVPLLREAHAGATGARRLLLARLLAWHRDSAGAETLIEAVRESLAGGTLPPITRHYRYAGVPPDNGIMPDPCYLLYALALLRDARIFPLLARIAAIWDPPVADFRDKKIGVFYYADAVCQAAERLGDPVAIPILATLASRAAVHGRTRTTSEPDFMLDRLAYLELCIGRALARCGSLLGAEILIGYLTDCRALFRKHARAELVEVTGHDAGAEGTAWSEWLVVQGNTLPARPWTRPLD